MSCPSCLKFKYIVLVALFIYFCFPRLLPVQASESLYFLHTDHLGSTAIISDQTGQIVSQQNYYPYGTARTVQGSQITERRYTGQVSDQDQTGLYYYNARYYDPRAAIFTQADYAGSDLHRYRYVNGRPLVSIDPSGHQCDGPNCSQTDQPASEAISDLARLLSENVGNTRENWLTGAQNVLTFALNLRDNPAIFYRANYLNFTPEEAENMERRFMKLKQEYEQMGSEASINAQVIGFGSENRQLGPGVFNRLGEPLATFSQIDFLAIWGVESRFIGFNGEVPADWTAVSIGANAYKGMPVNAVLDDNYNPYGFETAFEDFIYNARYFQWKSSNTDFGFEWWDWWNPNSDLWYEKLELYQNAFREFVDLHPEYAFILENIAIRENSPGSYEPI